MPKIKVVCKTCNEIFYIETDEAFYAFNCKICRSIYIYSVNKGNIEIIKIRNGSLIPKELEWTFTILNIERKYLNEDIIKTARKKQMELYHPDKVSHLGKEFSELANIKTIEINHAYDELIKWIEKESVVEARDLF